MGGVGWAAIYRGIDLQINEGEPLPSIAGLVESLTAMRCGGELREMYEFFSHTADLGLRVQAATLEALFVDAARGLTAMILADAGTLRAVEERAFMLDGESVEYLLFDWLSELLFAFECERLLFCEFEVRVSDGKLQAICRGERADVARHRLEHEVKAITYHGLRVEERDGAWLAEVIVDI
jgi:SHS2 domain-containing protein